MPHNDNNKYVEYMQYQRMGYKFIESLVMVDKIQKRRHKKWRINKKWIKRYGFIEIPKKDVYIMGKNIIGHPIVIDVIKKELNRTK